ncbi:MAG: hypothetical protein ABFS17_02720 [Chloroflexota bacterium]
MSPKPNLYDDDDGRVIVNMDVEGMPWHDSRKQHQNFSQQSTAQGGQMTRSESRLYTWYAVLYGLLIAAVFSATWILFTLFCTQIWFK